MKRDKKLMIANEFITIEIDDSKDYKGRVQEIREQIDRVCDDRLKELADKALKGKPVDIMNYNNAVIRDKQTRLELKRYFLNEFDRLLNLEKA